MALFVLFLGGGKFPFLSPFYPYFFPFFLFFFAKNAFFFGQNHSTKKHTTQNRIFGPCLAEHKRILVVVRSRVVRKPLENDFSETKGNDDDPKKSAHRVHVVGVFVGSVSGEERPVFFKNLCAFFSERERERERERSRKRSDRAKNDAAR